MRSRVTLMAAVAWLPVRSNHTKPDPFPTLPTLRGQGTCRYIFTAQFIAAISRAQMQMQTLRYATRALFTLVISLIYGTPLRKPLLPLSQLGWATAGRHLTGVPGGALKMSQRLLPSAY